MQILSADGPYSDTTNANGMINIGAETQTFSVKLRFDAYTYEFDDDSLDRTEQTFDVTVTIAP